MGRRGRAGQAQRGKLADELWAGGRGDSEERLRERGRGRGRDLQGQTAPSPNQSQAGGTFLPAGWELGILEFDTPPCLPGSTPIPTPGNL